MGLNTNIVYIFHPQYHVFEHSLLIFCGNVSSHSDVLLSN